jgi:hypothetical protein
VFLMHIARAYCVETGRVIDIYQARALFFAQGKPRHRLQFQCSDDACRAATATKVTAVNYDKLVAEGDQMVLKPHFRLNPQSPHIEVCEWVALERLIATGGGPDAEERKPTGVGFRHVKSTDLVDVYVLPTGGFRSVCQVGRIGASGADRPGEAMVRRAWSASERTRESNSDKFA